MEGYTPIGSQTDPRGVVKALFQENTFTELDDFIEIYQNSDDASSEIIKSKLITYNDKRFLYISDNGKGMDIKTMDMSLNLLGETNGSRKHGKFNFGGKAGILHLSGINDYLQSKGQYRGKCIVISKKSNCEPVCYEMIGKDLIERGWDGQVKPVILGSGDESLDSGRLFEEYSIQDTGTNIFIELTESRENTLKDIEYELREKLSLACNERLIHCGMSICFNDTDNGILQYTPILKDEIIDEKKASTNIDIYMKGTEKLYIIEKDHVKYAIKSFSEKKKSYTKEMKQLSERDLNDYEIKGTFILSSACDYEYTNGYIDGEDNNIYVIRNGFCLNKYNNTILQNKQKKNNQYNPESYTKKGVYSNTKFTLRYESNEIMDSLIGVNMQKADIKFTKLDKPFQRTIELIVLEHTQLFIDYILNNELPEPDPDPDPAPDPDPDPDPEPDPDPDPDPEPDPGTLDCPSCGFNCCRCSDPDPDPAPIRKMDMGRRVLRYLNSEEDFSEVNEIIINALSAYHY